MRRHGGKKLTRSQMTGLRGPNFVERIVLEMGFLWRGYDQSTDVGIDGQIEIRNPETGEATHKIINVQVKATEQPQQTASEVTLRCDARDIDYWLEGNVPVILVLVDLKGDVAYWIDVKKHFSEPNHRRDGYIRFDKASDQFNASSATDLMNLAGTQDQGLYYPATPNPQVLLTNLVEVNKFPEHIYVAQTDYRRPADIHDWARDNDLQLPSGWILTEKSLRSVYDLREHPWSDLVDRGSVECFDSEEWANSDDEDQRREFVRLMNLALKEYMHQQRLWFWNHDTYYFQSHMNEDGTLEKRVYGYRGQKKETKATVVTVNKHPKTHEITYYRHHAVRCRFERLRDRWYLRLCPDFVFTTDGKKTYLFGEELLAGKKRQENQAAVKGETVLWHRKLTQSGRSLWNPNPEPSLFEFGELLEVECPRSLSDKMLVPMTSREFGTTGGLFQ